MKKLIKKPSFFQIVFQSIRVSLFHNIKESVAIPEKIGAYKLKKVLKKQGNLANFHIGIYEKNGKKYFGKIWSKKEKDLSYFTLLNEYRVCLFLYKKLKRINCTLRVPQPVYIHETNNMLGVMFEYLTYPDISHLPPSKQAEIFKTVLHDLRTVSNSLTKEERQMFAKRSVIFYLISLPFHMLLSLKTRPKFFKYIFKAFIKLVVSIRTNNEFVLSHRDLRAPNVKLGKRFIYLLDSEDMTLTMNGYDLADVNILLGNQSKTKKVKIAMENKNQDFFANYISIQRSSNLLQDNRYINYLLNI